MCRIPSGGLRSPHQLRRSGGGQPNLRRIRGNPLERHRDHSVERKDPGHGRPEAQSRHASSVPSLRMRGVSAEGLLRGAVESKHIRQPLASDRASCVGDTARGKNGRKERRAGCTRVLRASGGPTAADASPPGAPTSNPAREKAKHRRAGRFRPQLRTVCTDAACSLTSPQSTRDQGWCAPSLSQSSGTTAFAPPPPVHARTTSSEAATSSSAALIS